MMKLKALMYPTLESSLDDCPSNSTAILLTQKLFKLKLKLKIFLYSSVNQRGRRLENYLQAYKQQNVVKDLKEGNKWEMSIRVQSGKQKPF